VRLSDAFGANLPRNMDDVHERKLTDATRGVEVRVSCESLRGLGCNRVLFLGVDGP
jgi:hypothetical protein